MKKQQKNLMGLLLFGGLLLVVAVFSFTSDSTRNADLKTSTFLIYDYNDDNYKDNYKDNYNDEDYNDNYNDEDYNDNYNDESHNDDNYNDDNYNDDNYNDESHEDDNYNDDHNDEDYNDEDYNDESHDIYKDCFGAGNDECRDQSLKWDYRDIERIKRETKQLTRKENENTEELKRYINQLDLLKERYDNARTQDEIDAIREEVSSIQKELERFRMQGEIGRMEKELQRDIKRFEKDRRYLNDIKNTVSGEWAEKINNQLENFDKYLSLQEEILEAIKAGKDWMEIDDIRWELDDLRWAIDDFWMTFEEIKNQQWAGQMFDEIEKSIEDFLATEYPRFTGEMKEKADELVRIARSLIAQGREAQANGNKERLEEIQFKLDELGRKAERLFGKPKPRFDDMGFDNDFDDEFDDFSEDMSYDKQMEIVQQILRANPNIIQQILLGDPILAERTFKIFNKVPEDMQAGYLEGKAKLSDLYLEIEKSVQQIRQYKEDILGYNYYGEAMDELTAFLEEVRDGTMTLETLKSKLNELKEKSKAEKHSVGIISFPDYDDDDWYYEDVEDMKKEGFIKGKQGVGGVSNFAGGDNITFAEALKVTLERFEKGQAGGVPLYAGAQGHWARGYYKMAEQMGITLLPTEHFVTRGEFSRLIVEAALGAPTVHESSSFSDLSISNPYFNYLETLHDYDIISGDAGGAGLATVRSGDNLNRAEAAKVINKAFKNLQFEIMDVEELGSLLDF